LIFICVIFVYDDIVIIIKNSNTSKSDRCHLTKFDLRRVYTCTLDNQVPNEKIYKSIFMLSRSRNV